jgi:hypothetical protein
MGSLRSFSLSLIAAFALGAVMAPVAQAQVVESIDPARSVTASSTPTFLESGTAYTLRCTHDFTIPTAAFLGTGSVSIEAANNLYTACRDSFGATCTIRVNGRWTITAATVTSGTLRLDSTMTIDCTNRAVRPYSCVFAVQSGQAFAFTFTNPVAPTATGTLTLDTPNSLRAVVEASSSRCPLGAVGTRLTFTVGERLSTENVRIR